MMRHVCFNQFWDVPNDGTGFRVGSMRIEATMRKSGMVWPDKRAFYSNYDEDGEAWESEASWRRYPTTLEGMRRGLQYGDDPRDGLFPAPDYDWE